MRVVALLALAFVGLGPLPAAAESIKLGAVVPLTGRYGAGGAQVRAGYEIDVQHVNGGGGVAVGGRKMPLELVLLDDESDATKTVSRLETLAAHGVVAYLGGFGSDLHAAAASVAEKNRIPYLGVAFALYKVHQQGFHYLFSPFWKSPDIGQQTQGLLSTISAAERPKTVAIFQEKTDWGREMATAWTEAGKAAGYQVVVQGEYAPGGKDFSDLILKAKAAAADAVTRAGSLDREKVRDAIAATDMTTVIGPVKFRPDGTGIVQSVFVQWLNGKQELIWPRESATAPLAYPAPPFAKR